MKTAVVTGGRRGIGLGIALAMLEAGYRVVVVAKSKDRGTLPDGIAYVQCDLANAEQRALLATLAPDVLVNNAGMNADHAAKDFPMEDWGRVIEVNLTAVFDLSQQAYRTGCKRIVNITSMNAFQGARRRAAYVASKHGLAGLTKCLSNEWAPEGVTVNCVAPGYIETDMMQFESKEHREAMLGRIPAGKFGQPSDVAEMVLILASDAAQYVTGNTICVDGGWMGR